MTAAGALCCAASDYCTFLQMVVTRRHASLDRVRSASDAAGVIFYSSFAVDLARPWQTQSSSTLRVVP